MPLHDKDTAQLKRLSQDQRTKPLRDDPRVFRESLLIDTDDGPARLAPRLDPWQRKDFEALDGAWKAVAASKVGNKNKETTSTDPTPITQESHRAWLERPRGHSKTNDLAVMVSWVMYASSRRLVGVAAAADKDQARLLRDAVEKLARLNPWLSTFLDVQAYRIVNRLTGSTLEILSADAASSFGLTPDFVIIDELTHHPKRDLWDSLISSAAKRQRCMVVIITNAGYTDSWQYRTREVVRSSEDWHFSHLDGPQASWISQKQLAEQRRLLPSVAFDRLWLNRWAEGGGDALTPQDIDGAVVLSAPTKEKEMGWAYISGMDLSVSRDATALVTIGMDVGWIEDVVEKDGENGKDSEANRRKGEPHAVRIAREQGWLEDGGTELDDGEVGVNADGTPSHHTTPTDYIAHKGTGRLKLVDVQIWQPQRGQRVDLNAVKQAVLDLHNRFGLSAVGVDPFQSELLVQQLRSAGVPIEGIAMTGPVLQQIATTTLEAFREKRIDLFDCPELLGDLRALRVVEKSYGFRLDSPRRTGDGSDGAGAGGADGTQGTRHGDAASALQLALWLARDQRFQVPADMWQKWQGRELVCWP